MTSAFYSESRSCTLSAMKVGQSCRSERLWLGGALLFTLLFAGRTMAPAFRTVEAIQDDAAQHVFWMLRYRDPELFPSDLYADYFQSLAPPGYQAVYWGLSWVIDPVLASKLLPPLLGGIAALFTFRFVRHLYPSPTAAFLATVLLSWYVWQYDDLPSATARAFLLPTLAALLWCLVAGRVWLAVAVVVLAALLYPIGGVLGVALLATRLVPIVGRLGREHARTARSGRRADWLALLAAAILVAVVLLPSAVRATGWGPAVTGGQARAMPEFGERGRNAFFVEGAYEFWLASFRSGLNLRVSDTLFPQAPILFEYAGLAALLPLLLWRRRRLPAAGRVDGRTMILLGLLGVSIGLFFLAHALLFRLYLPARYVQWSLPLAFSVAAGLALAVVVDEVAARLWPPRQVALAGALTILLGVAVAAYPAEYHGGFVPDRRPAVTAYLRAQPKDTLVAAPPMDASFLPALTGRGVLVAQEFALAYHLGYYGQVRERMTDLIDAYYDEGTRRLSGLIDRYGVDFFLVQNDAFEATRYTRVWGSAFEPYTSAIAARLNRPRRYALQDLARRCSVVNDGTVALVPASCVQARAYSDGIRTQQTR